MEDWLPMCTGKKLYAVCTEILPFLFPWIQAWFIKHAFSDLTWKT